MQTCKYLSYCCLVITHVVLSPAMTLAEPGVTETTIRVGSTVDLTEQNKELGRKTIAGLSAAFADEIVQERQIKLVKMNDSHTPEMTEIMTKKLIDQGIFLMIGSVGTATTEKALPILARQEVPAVGFVSGSDILRPGVGDVVNFRASYYQEIEKVIDAALKWTLQPDDVCAYVQNDVHGMSGVRGVVNALTDHPQTQKKISTLEKIINISGLAPERNDIGPVGVYERNTFQARQGYLSLKNWEKQAGRQCRLVVTTGTTEAIANFIAYSLYQDEDWIISAVSSTDAKSLISVLDTFNINSGVIMTQVVPVFDTALPIVQEAKAAIGIEFDSISLEGYIVGKLFLTILKRLGDDITRQNFLQAVRGKKFDLGGLPIDFSDGNQGSDSVVLTYLDDGRFRPMKDADWQALIK